MWDTVMSSDHALAYMLREENGDDFRGVSNFKLFGRLSTIVIHTQNATWMMTKYTSTTE